MRLFTIGAALVAALSIPAQAFPAAPRCGPLEEVENIHRERFGERFAAQGADYLGFLMRLYVNPETGSWTLAYLRPDGLICGLSHGEGWQATGREPGGEGV